VLSFKVFYKKFSLLMAYFLDLYFMKNSKKNSTLEKREKDTKNYYKLFNGGDQIKGVFNGINLILSLFIKKNKNNTDE